MSNRTAPLLLGSLLLTGIGLSAQVGSVQRVQPPAPGVSFAGAWRPGDARGDTRIVGSVMDIRQVPVAGATVRLRNLITGEVAEQTVSNEAGEYTFVLENPGTYVVEMVMLDGSIVALSNAGSLARYETLQTVVLLPGRWEPTARTVIIAQGPATFLGMSAQTSMTAATLGMAMSQNLPPVDAGEPVSPVRP
jgi:hypothetical protein